MRSPLLSLNLAFPFISLFRTAVRPNVNKVHMNDEAPNHENASVAADAVEFATTIGRLKTTPRTGWVRQGVPRPESVADHSWRVAALALLLVGRTDVDVGTCMQMAVVHDLAECLVGDIAPDDNVPKDEKQRLEHAAIERLATELSKANGLRGMKSQKHLMDLFQAYEARESKESQLVKDLDLLDMIVQAGEYEDAYGIDLSDFFTSTPPSRFQDEWVRAVAQQVHTERNVQKQGPTSLPNTLSPSDSAFVDAYSTASREDHEVVAKVVRALRGWESRQPEKSV